jgi:hypothetical protein
MVFITGFGNYVGRERGELWLTWSVCCIYQLLGPESHDRKYNKTQTIIQVNHLQILTIMAVTTSQPVPPKSIKFAIGAYRIFIVALNLFH